MNYKLKDTSKEVVIGFNQSAKPLGERDDIDKLIEIAVSTGNQEILKHFDHIPTSKEIEKEKIKDFIDKTEQKK